MYADAQVRNRPFLAVGRRQDFDAWVHEKLAAEYESERRKAQKQFKEQWSVSPFHLVHAYPKALPLAAAEVRMRGVQADPTWDALPDVVADFGREDDSGGMRWWYSAATIDEFVLRYGCIWDRLTPEAQWAECQGLAWTEWQDLLYWNDDLSLLRKYWGQVKETESAQP